MKLKDIIKECGCLTEPDGTIKGWEDNSLNIYNFETDE